jgi:predicted esterase
MVPPATMAAEAERLSAAGVAFTLQKYQGGHEIAPDGLRSLLS